MRSSIILLLFFISIVSTSTAQIGQQRQLSAKRTAASFKIDGNLDEAAWKDAPLATDFIEWRPNSGAKEENKTEVWILYDNTSIYVAGFCHEKTADSVSRELAGRDRVGNSDFVGVIFDTYNDKINAVGFYVTTTGEQFDAKYSGTGSEDANWSAVWESEAKVVKDGWTFEMRIPYSALRFTSKENQNWGMNITRRRQKTGQQYMWNPIDPKLDGFVNQEGLWTGIEKIESPIRLSFSPYLSYTVNNYPYNTKDVKNTTGRLNGGMDIKYGITQSFTLDMTLIPDFGQVQSDNTVLNRSPFEVRYDENRSFFTEGTELFNKGNFFYSRRIGGTPLNYSNAYDQSGNNEIVKKNPTESKLINATKISGRTSKGLGIGFFNALTKPMYATLEDTLTGFTREVETNPLTNFNILVLDQTLKNNSSISLINTNVTRSGQDYDANVTAGMFDFYNKKNIYNWNGKFAVSNIFAGPKNTITGYSHTLGFGKPGGNFNYFISEELLDDKFNYNDLGIMFNNNYLDHTLWMGYKILKPAKWYKRIFFNFNNTLSTRFNPSSYQVFYTNFNVNGQLKNLANAGIFIGFNAKGNDFYEPHSAGYVYKTPERYMANLWYGSNSAKKYSYNISGSIEGRNLTDYLNYDLDIFNKYRFSDKFSLSHELYSATIKNDIGFADVASGVVFSQRNINTVSNVLNVKYSFNKNNDIRLRARHYWSQIDAQKYFTLEQTGKLSPNTTYTGNADQNFNVFNIDMTYTWQFAPGSFINIVWKNSATDFEQQTRKRYFNNFRHTIETPQNNNFSIKILYYLDYLKFKSKKSV